MSPEELAARLAALEESNAASQQEAQLNGFMGQFGGAFNNNRSIGSEVLNRLEASQPGMVASATMDAVQNILTQLTEQVDAAFDEITMIQKDLKTTISDVGDAVNAATGEAPDQIPQQQDPAITPPAPMDAAPPAPMDAAPPAPMDAAPPAPMDAAPPADAPPPAAPDPTVDAAMAPMPPNQMSSDERLKNIRSLIKPRVPAAPVKKQHANVLGAIKQFGGLG